MKLANYSRVSLAVMTTIFMLKGAHATNIELSYDPAEFADANGVQALAGFQQAANFWENLFSDSVTINLNIGFAGLGDRVIGSTLSNRAVFFYQDVALGLINDAKSAIDASAVNNLQCDRSQPNDAAATGVCALRFLDQEEDTASPGLDADGTGDNIALALTQANAKALGFTANSWGTAFLDVDAEVTFSSDFAFDFDSSDGIDNDKMDFVGVAIHEIGHALGFTSGVDAYDYNYNEVGPNDLDPYAIGNTLDLFRYSSESLAQGADVLEWRPGADSYLSVDGGATSIASLSTGRFGGDNQQASHFKDDLGLGIMDPTFRFGELGRVSGNDLIAFDAIGWDIRQVPEPTSIALFGLAAFGLLASRKKYS